MHIKLTFAAAILAAALSSCGQAAETPAAAPSVNSNTNAAPLAYIVSQHSPLLDEAVRIAISQDFNGAPLNGARTQHLVTAESVRCRSLTPPAGAPDCSVTYGPNQQVAITGEDATALFAALAAAGAQDAVDAGAVTREVSALQCTVDDAAAQDTPATGDQVAGFSCRFAAPTASR